MEYIEIVLPDMEKAAQTVARKWPQSTTAEDLYQDLVVHFLEREGSLENLALLEPDKRVARLVAIGHEKAAKARDDFEVFSGNVSYSVDEVRLIAQNRHGFGEVKRDNVVGLDFQVGMEELAKKNKRYHDIIVQVYLLGKKYAGNSNEIKNVLPRAIESLTTHMNRISAAKRYSFDNGGRHRNNTQGRKQVELDYLGEGV